jgi:NAD(P)-dependent dehydrogenase (short-subunit alcohol dehydrogenase family)
MDIRLDGKVALVTGASKGIGKAIASELAASGAAVMLSSRKLDGLQAAIADLEARTPSAQLDAFPANAGDIDAGEAAVRATIDRFGGLDILVNNAATNPHYGPALDVEPRAYDKTFEVNLRGPLFWSKAAHRLAFAAQPGVIVNIASVGGLRSEVGLGVYNLTKAAIIHLTRVLAGEIGPTRVVGIAPGLVDTDFAAVLVENFGDRLAKSMPTGRLGHPEDIANLATFLCSEQASWITGETFVIDGGAGVRSGST